MIGAAITVAIVFIYACGVVLVRLINPRQALMAGA